MKYIKGLYLILNCFNHTACSVENINAEDSSVEKLPFISRLENISPLKQVGSIIFAVLGAVSAIYNSVKKKEEDSKKKKLHQM